MSGALAGLVVVSFLMAGLTVLALPVMAVVIWVRFDDPSMVITLAVIALPLALGALLGALLL